MLPPLCTQCGHRHDRVILEVRLFRSDLSGTETVECFRPDQLAEAMDRLAEYGAKADQHGEPVDCALDVWVVDSVLGDGDPVGLIESAAAFGSVEG